MRVRRFEDLLAWQKARQLTREVYRLTNAPLFSRDFGLCDQIRRASVSIMSNLAEGFDRASRAEFHRFIVISKGSCAEVRSLFYVALDAGYITANEFDTAGAMADEVARIIAGLRTAVSEQREKGQDSGPRTMSIVTES